MMQHTKPIEVRKQGKCKQLGSNELQRLLTRLSTIFSCSPAGRTFNNSRVEYTRWQLRSMHVSSSTSKCGSISRGLLSPSLKRFTWMERITKELQRSCEKSCVILNTVNIQQRACKVMTHAIFISGQDDWNDVRTVSSR